MIDMPALDLPAAILMPQEIDRRKRNRSAGTRAAIGAFIILQDGSECVVAGYDRNGNVLCHPVTQ